MTTTINSTLHQKRIEICNLNHGGIQLLEYGFYDGAIASFTQALGTIKVAYHQEKAEQEDKGISNNHNNNNNNNNNDEMIADWFSQRILRKRREGECSKLSTVMSSLLSSSSSSSSFAKTFSDSSFFGYVYQDPLELPLDSAVIPFTTTLTTTMNQGMLYLPLQVHSIAVMFNLAIAFHRKGLTFRRQGNLWEGNAALDHAKGLYELSYEMMATERVNPGVYFIMAIANNLGQLHTMLHDYEKARQCYDHLLSIQMFVTNNQNGFCGGGSSSITSNNNNNNNSPSESDQERHNMILTAAAWEGFSHSTSLLILTDCCASAA